MERIKKLLLENKAWAAEQIIDDPDFFKRLSDIQTPEFLWIGCSDSRVPANEITGTQPGEIFVHRNIANLVFKDDINLLSVLEYAVHYLKVKHVIICGHYGCGGVAAATSDDDFGLINKWLVNIKKVKKSHEEELSKIKDKNKMLERMVELNVMAQVQNLSETDPIKRAWKEKGNYPIIHGWVYGLKDGLLKSVCSMDKTTES